MTALHAHVPDPADRLYDPESERKVARRLRSTSRGKRLRTIVFVSVAAAIAAGATFALAPAPAPQVERPSPGRATPPAVVVDTGMAARRPDGVATAPDHDPSKAQERFSATPAERERVARFQLTPGETAPQRSDDTIRRISLTPQPPGSQPPAVRPGTPPVIEMIAQPLTSAPLPSRRPSQAP